MPPPRLPKGVPLPRPPPWPPPGNDASSAALPSAAPQRRLERSFTKEDLKRRVDETVDDAESMQPMEKAEERRVRDKRERHFPEADHNDAEEAFRNHDKDDEEDGSPPTKKQKKEKKKPKRRCDDDDEDNDEDPSPERTPPRPTNLPLQEGGVVSELVAISDSKVAITAAGTSWCTKWRRALPKPIIEEKRRAWVDLKALELMSDEERLAGVFKTLADPDARQRAWERTILRQDDCLHAR